jgi:hypothetical protein
VLDQEVGVAATPLKVSVLPLCVAPKFVPVTVTVTPAAPEVGLTEAIDGVGVVVFALPPPLPPEPEHPASPKSALNNSRKKV